MANEKTERTKEQDGERGKNAFKATGINRKGKWGSSALKYGLWVAFFLRFNAKKSPKTIYNRTEKWYYIHWSYTIYNRLL